MADFWLISVPLDKTSLTSVEKLKRIITKTHLGSCWRFPIPDLKVRVLVVFIYLFFCLKWYSRSYTCFFCCFFSSVDLMNRVTKFQWDKAKYPTALPLSTLTDIINKVQSFEDLRSRATAYNSLKASLQSLELNLNGNLQTRSLNDVLRKDDLVVSEYLTTLLVVVEKYLRWEKSYESLSEFVVPRSSRKIFEDGDGGIFTVTLFKRAVCKFKAKAQESKFIVRDYSFDEEERKQQEIMKLTVHKKDEYGIFVRWLKVNFTQVFIAWIHLKALRVFVESVLRYGLPVNYQALILETDRKRSKKLKEELSSLFVHLDPTVSCDIPGLCQQEYSSYICFHISTSMLEISEPSTT
uniref:V-type proton ATPase subunit C n=1 Tax=Poecilia reticulata TaxID=8081 RepID=A0A3P9NA27_POERE